MVKQHTAITGDLRSQLLENRWLEGERVSGDAEKCPSTPSPGYGPSLLYFGQVPGLLRSNFLQSWLWSQHTGPRALCFGWVPVLLLALIFYLVKQKGRGRRRGG